MISCKTMHIKQGKRAYKRNFDDEWANGDAKKYDEASPCD